MQLRNKKILVTGADGFIGSHLVEALLKEGAKVTAFVCYNAFNSWGWLDTLSKNVVESLNIISGDVRDPNGVRQAVKNQDIVFHLAALIGIPFSYHSPDSYLDTNIRGTLNILQAAKEHACEKILVTSTSEVYGTARFVPITEDHPRQGQSPYSATKIAADALAESFYKSFDVPVVIVRPFNTYGPRQSARAVIPTIITQLLSGEKMVKAGYMNATRDFLYVLDTVAAFIEIVKADGLIGQEINVASNSEIRISDLADLLIKKIEPLAKIIEDKDRIRPEKSEVERLFGDNSKIIRMTNWRPKVSLETGLDQTIEWFKTEQHNKLYKHAHYAI